MFSHYQKVLSIRAAYKEIFANGERTVVMLSDEEGYDVVKRSYEGASVYVALNITAAAKELTIPVDMAAGTRVQDLYGGKIYTVSESGEVTLTIPAAAEGGTAILVLAPEGAIEDTPVETPTETPGDETKPKNNIGWIIAAVGAGAVAIGAGTAVAIKKKKSK